MNLDVQTILGRFVGCKVNQDELGWLQVFIRGCGGFKVWRF